jgi:hypothetical protein
LGKAYGLLNTQVLLANLQHFCCNNNIIILNYYYFIPGLFPSHSWWAESCSVRLSRGMVCSRQPRSFQGVDPHGRPDGWTEDGWRDARIQGRLHFSSRRPLLYRIFFKWPAKWLQTSMAKYSRFFWGVCKTLQNFHTHQNTLNLTISCIDHLYSSATKLSAWGIFFGEVLRSLDH